jgi:mono/diheme cytochrome c family protein
MNPIYFRTALAALLLASVASHAADQDASVNRGKELYNKYCMSCHREGGWASSVLAKRMPKEVSALEKRTDLAPKYVERIARIGLNNMPGYRPTELTDGDLKEIGEYLTRNNK